MNSMKEFQKETQKELAELKKYKLNHMNMALSPYTAYSTNSRQIRGNHLTKNNGAKLFERKQPSRQE